VNIALHIRQIEQRPSLKLRDSRWLARSLGIGLCYLINCTPKHANWIIILISRVLMACIICCLIHRGGFDVDMHVVANV
jgi:hypothetical protein